MLRSGIFSVVMLASSAFAHPIEPNTNNGKAATEVQAMRREFVAAATAKDAAALKRFYAEDFTHTHTSGKVDGKDARIVSVLTRRFSGSE